jgi:hypothetical protein
MIATSLLLIILIVTAAVSGYCAVQVQKALFQRNVFFFYGPANNQSSISNLTSKNCPNLPTNTQILTYSPSFQTPQESQSFLQGNKTYIINDSETP